MREDLTNRMADAQARIAAWANGRDPQRRRYSDAELDEAERTRGVRLPSELRTLYHVIGSGPFGFFFIEPPDDPWETTTFVLSMIETERADRIFDSPHSDLVEGASPSPEALSFGGLETSKFFFDPAGGGSRIVIHQGGVGFLRRSATVAHNLADFLECIASLCEAGALEEGSGGEHPPAGTGVTWVWDPAPYRHILAQHGVTGAILLSPHLD